VKPHVVPSSMLWPPSVIAPSQLPPVLLATIVFLSVARHALSPVSPQVAALPIAPPPPASALLPEKVLLVMVRVPALQMPPPAPVLLLKKVLLVTVSVPALKMAPPDEPLPLAMVRFWT
jgi:hypothetical protein